MCNQYGALRCEDAHHSRRLKPVHHRHCVIEQDDVRFCSSHQLYGGISVFRFTANDHNSGKRCALSGQVPTGNEALPAGYRLPVKTVAVFERLLNGCIDHCRVRGADCRERHRRDFAGRCFARIRGALRSVWVTPSRRD